jgi:hypothetical protein
VSRIQHQNLRFGYGGYFLENLLKNSGFVPPQEAVIEHLIEAVALGRIPPGKAPANDANNSADGC